MVAELAEISKKLNARLNRAAKRSATGGEASKKTAVQSPPLQPHATNADDSTGEETGTCRPSQKTTTFDEMMALWKSECHESWAYLPSRDREKVIETIRRARRRARVDVVEFLKDVFRGRGKVSKQDLFGVAATHGFARGTIRKALKWLGYRTKRKGRGWGASWFILNPDRDWKDHLPVFTDTEIKAAVDAQPDPTDTAAANDGWKSRRADYLEDL